MSDTPSTVSIEGVAHKIKLKTYSVVYPVLKNSKATVTGGHHYTSGGIWKRKFKVTILCYNDGVDGGAVAERDALLTTLDTSGELAYIGPDGDTANVHLDSDINVTLAFDFNQGLGWEYEVDLNLIED
jgi:hypothetical protein